MASFNWYVPASIKSLKKFLQNWLNVFLKLPQNLSIRWLADDLPVIKLLHAANINLQFTHKYVYSFAIRTTISRYTFDLLYSVRNLSAISCMSLLECPALSHTTFLENSSIAPWIANPYGFNLSYPSIWIRKFGPLLK